MAYALYSMWSLVWYGSFIKSYISIYACMEAFVITTLELARNFWGLMSSTTPRFCSVKIPFTLIYWGSLIWQRNFSHNLSMICHFAPTHNLCLFIILLFFPTTWYYMLWGKASTFTSSIYSLPFVLYFF